MFDVWLCLMLGVVRFDFVNTVITSIYMMFVTIIRGN